MSSPGKTRILTTDDLIRPSESQGPSGGDRGAARVAVPPRPPAPPVRPVEPPKPPPPPVVRPQAQVVAAPLRPQRPESHWGMWVALIVLLMGIGGGGLYIATRSPNPGGTLTATLNAEPTTIEKGQSVTLRWSSQNATDLDLEPGVGKVKAEGYTSVTPDDSTTYTLTATGPGGAQSPTAHVNVTIPSTPQPPPPNPEPTPKPPRPGPTPIPEPPPPVVKPAGPAVNPTEVRGKISLGDFHYKRGEYDDAIASYEEGLRMDPTNAELRQKLEETINACKKENAILNESFKCGGR
jgi:hypothetical protein